MTSIEWLLSELEKVNYHPTEAMIMYAKKLHKKEIENAYCAGEDNIDNDGCTIIRDNEETYYNETFVSKGSDEVELPKHPCVISENGNELLFDKEGNLIKELPKQEKTLYTEEQVREAIEMARGIKDDEMTFDVSSIIGCGEVCTYGWKEEYTNEEIIQSLKPPKKD